MLITPQNLLIDHVDVVGRHKVVDDEILQLQFLLQHSPPLLQVLNLLRIHFLQFPVLIFQVLQSLDLLFDLQLLILVLLLQTVVSFLLVDDIVFFLF